MVYSCRLRYSTHLVTQFPPPPLLFAPQSNVSRQLIAAQTTIQLPRHDRNHGSRLRDRTAASVHVDNAKGMVYPIKSVSIKRLVMTVRNVLSTTG